LAAGYSLGLDRRRACGADGVARRDGPGPERWRTAAVTVNGALLVAGACLVVRPGLPADAWTGQAVLVMSLLNTAAILLPSNNDEQARARRRLRRIMRLVNVLLAGCGLLFLAASAGHGFPGAAEGTALAIVVGAPLLNALAIPHADSTAAGAPVRSGETPRHTHD
jgi:hypothetical protein